jgi:hypothetical protein
MGQLVGMGFTAARTVHVVLGPASCLQFGARASHLELISFFLWKQMEPKMSFRDATFEIGRRPGFEGR